MFTIAAMEHHGDEDHEAAHRPEPAATPVDPDVVAAAAH